MTDVAIRVEKLGKLYHIGQRGHHHTLRETLARATSASIRALTSARNGVSSVGSRYDFGISTHQSDAIWALKDVSFEIKRGEIVGIIGPNGSGKSTLLKLLAQITEPTEGEIYINGRITAVIELGAGFHPELTGRENIFLNGAILGMTRKEIEEKFEEIVEFAGLTDFMETPVKHYSSGMAVRLGFSLAISVDPEILLVDEVLAVGDAAFKKRCFERMDGFIRAGKTIVIVTHNLQEIQRIARRAILIYEGTIQADDPPDTVIGKYSSLVRKSSNAQIGLVPKENKKREDDPTIQIVNLQVCGSAGNEALFFNTHDEVQVVITYRAHRTIVDPMFRVLIYRADGLLCHGMNTVRSRIEMGGVCGEGSVILRYPNLRLLQGDYSFHAAVFAHHDDDLPLHQVSTQRAIHVDSRMVDGAGVLTMESEWIITSKDY
ncbi:MAG TPA: ABC transporter ATP-binding protein [Candidatus Binatia bacterium]|jgi:lipopolysaccharide transport system ATP-binding protein